MCQDTKKKKLNGIVVSNKQIANGIYEMVFEQPIVADKTTAGQFINLYCKSRAHILPRPISICEVDKENGTVKIVYAVVGYGTQEFSQLTKGEEVQVLGPLGNGFCVADNKENNSRMILVGGGVGTPPMLELAKSLEQDCTVVLGYRTEPYLVEEFKKYADKVLVATDDGSYGYKGTVVDLMNKESVTGDMLYACGPKPMLKALQKWCEEKDIEGQLSLEERMGCGFGACVGCVVKIRETGAEDWTYKKVCKDGPVFFAREVVFDD